MRKNAREIKKNLLLVMPSRLTKRRSSKRRGRMEQANAATDAGRDPVTEVESYLSSANPEHQKMPEYISTTPATVGAVGGVGSVGNPYSTATPEQIAYALGPVDDGSTRENREIPSNYINPKSALPLHMEGRTQDPRFHSQPQQQQQQLQHQQRGPLLRGGGRFDPQQQQQQQQQQQHQEYPRQQNEGEVTIVNHTGSKLLLRAITESGSRVDKQIAPKKGESFYVPIGTTITLLTHGSKRVIYKQVIRDPTTMLGITTSGTDSVGERFRWIVIGFAVALALILLAIGLFYLIQRIRSRKLQARV